MRRYGEPTRPHVWLLPGVQCLGRERNRQRTLRMQPQLTRSRHAPRHARNARQRPSSSGQFVNSPLPSCLALISLSGTDTPPWQTNRFFTRCHATRSRQPSRRCEPVRRCRMGRWVASPTTATPPGGRLRYVSWTRWRQRRGCASELVRAVVCGTACAVGALPYSDRDAPRVPYCHTPGDRRAKACSVCLKGCGAAETWTPGRCRAAGEGAVASPAFARRPMRRWLGCHARMAACAGKGRKRRKSATAEVGGVPRFAVCSTVGTGDQDRQPPPAPGEGAARR
ncbi:hypothetical protein SSPIM334S_07895 [Streptomyces spiroverticillatus]